MATAFIYSFRDASDKFTLHNYQVIFADPNFKKALINTAIFVLISVTIEFVISLGLALADRAPNLQ